MFIPTKNREEIMQYLFREGVIVAENKNQKKHPALSVPNLEVIQLMRGFESRKLVKQQYAWRHYYWYLTNEGISHLREVLHLPADIVPATLKKTARSVAQAADGDNRRRWREDNGGKGERRTGGFGGRGGGGDRACYNCGETGHLARDCPGKTEAPAEAAAAPAAPVEEESAW
eukprot:TRINITY_DN860_c0_g1_i1.p2 TRINITY_DN860_c0_g1~~TRINITY_DN860_c0_g1_i1.p2  ORF type:complete len:173 (+),score=44.37 TRINITY_DN860_c0_g1_i1:52-570(+)